MCENFQGKKNTTKKTNNIKSHLKTINIGLRLVCLRIKVYFFVCVFFVLF